MLCDRIAISKQISLSQAADVTSDAASLLPPQASYLSLAPLNLSICGHPPLASPRQAYQQVPRSAMRGVAQCRGCYMKPAGPSTRRPLMPLFGVDRILETSPYPAQEWLKNGRSVLPRERSQSLRSRSPRSCAAMKFPSMIESSRPTKRSWRRSVTSQSSRESLASGRASASASLSWVSCPASLRQCTT